MQWKKLGCIFSPRENPPYFISHAANPLPCLIDGDVYRIFYSGRDAQKRSSVGAIDFDLKKMKVIQYHDKPFFTFGPEDSFYSEGVSIGDRYNCNNRDYILFMAWQNKKDSHWRGEIGRLNLSKDLQLSLADSSPFISLDQQDPISLSYPCVFKNAADSYLMCYGSTVSWTSENGEMLHILKMATSKDGQIWERQGVHVPFEIGHAQAFSRPTVIYKNNLFHLWFSYRGTPETPYRIGHAYSGDGLTWTLNLEGVGITVSSSGWDSEMIEYPYVFEHKSNTYMLYNGNQFGKTGFGLAELILWS